MKVIKFGGSSLADAKQIKKAAEIICDDRERRIVVVSAPGKRYSQDRKVTDLLIELACDCLEGRDCVRALEGVISRYRQIAEELGIRSSIADEIEGDIKHRISSAHLPEKKFLDLIKAAGEDNCARLIAAYLCQKGENAEYVNPKDAGLMLCEEEGHVKILPSSYEALSKLKERKSLMVFPGFFGYSPEGEVITFPRGGSDITGSILAAAVNAALYENFTDVDSVFAASPSVIRNPAPIRTMSYEEMRELSGAGFGVLHEEAVAPAWRKGIPINIRNTNNPKEPGTMIVSGKCGRNHPGIVGIAAEKGFVTMHVTKSLMKYETGFERNLLGILDEEGLTYDYLTIGIDNVSFTARASETNAEKRERIVKRIYTELKADKIEIENNRAVIMLIGQDIARYAEAAGKACDALTAEKISVKMVNQNTAEGSILFEVEEKEADLAVKVLYRSFFQKKERICLNRRNSNSRDFRAFCTKTPRGTVEG
ncbi:aspartate kinase [Murimonas intestini]|uniref:Aspartokinase n=1 Tax=Murimonas intestini TaxID=1337051 RepID=A0AB73T239_9FIRM|nr:aspartate kinase [Murimonas intestini]MCR1842675.1 aspartate kinase [Murimonas intestini]MCR1867278.1 aspartate kinase [Murimonas intestini]MCR1884464.1 aspartate kinase [Murimonas intestini]